MKDITREELLNLISVVKVNGQWEVGDIEGDVCGNIKGIVYGDIWETARGSVFGETGETHSTETNITDKLQQARKNRDEAQARYEEALEEHRAAYPWLLIE